MTLRFKIGDVLAVTFLVALFFGFYAPELRSLDRNARIVFGATAIITGVSLVSFTPVWIVLYRLRKRSQERLRIGPVQYATVFTAFLSSLGIIVAINRVAQWLVIR